MQTIGIGLEIKGPAIQKIGCWAGALLLTVFLTACGNSEAPENAENSGIEEHTHPKVIEGLRLLKEKKYEKAMNTVFEVLANDPDNTEALSAMAWIYVKQGRLEDAFKMAKASLKMDPNQSLAYVVLARVHFQTSGFDDSLDSARQALILNPKSIHAYHVIGEVYLRKGLNKDALTVIKEALKLEPNDPEILNLLGAGYMKDKQYEKALPFLLKALEIDPDLPGAHFNSALVYARLKDGKRAIQHIDRAEHLYTQAENKPWMAKARDVRRVITRKFKFTPDGVVS